VLIAPIWIVALVFPKAGLNVGDVPLTVASVVVMVYGAFHFAYPGYPARRRAESRRFTRVHLGLVWILILSLVANLGSLDTVDLTTWLLLVGSPLAFHAGLRTKDTKRVFVVVLCSTVAVGFYGLAQNLFGVSETAIPGLTHIYGEDLIRNNPIRTASGTLKSPSFYHNGNLAAAFLLSGLGFALFASRVDRRLRGLAVLALLGAVLGVAVSLARAGALGFVVAALIALSPRYRPPWIATRAATMASVLFVAAGAMLLGYILTGSTTFLVERYVFESLADPTAAGRTDGYAAWWSDLTSQSFFEFFHSATFGDWSINPVEDQLEGIPAIIANYGLFGFMAMVALVAVPFKMIRESLGSEGTVYWFGLAATAAMWLIDNTFLFPPTLMTWFLLAGLTVQISIDKAATQGLDQNEHKGSSAATPAGLASRSPQLDEVSAS